MKGTVNAFVYIRMNWLNQISYSETPIKPVTKGPGKFGGINNVAGLKVFLPYVRK